MAFMITACGFQLRGTMNVASEIQKLSLQVSDRAFQRTLSESLKQAGITVTSNAPYQIHITSLEHEEATVTTSGGGIVTDYDVTGSLSWQLISNDGLILIPDTLLQQHGTYQRHNNQYNASQSEASDTWNEIQRNLAANLTRRVASLSQEELTALIEQAVKAREAAEAVALPASDQGQ
ncbi:LPS-assembly lipoprotein LptE [Sansalvadorimonas verongulae]|uniref:LPS-assembly lipoprotein LptE n=1 Tax=Sansalvadorimonas verongulae TaxID=2172824 RepID=UPI0018AD1299|nr:LPS assembly lipoprotein LptE [Sansalvadorimonas verongulae]